MQLEGQYTAHISLICKQHTACNLTCSNKRAEHSSDKLMQQEGQHTAHNKPCSKKGSAQLT
eukprot:1137030-Pelagomonas_calceolata.AAC.7